ncbi:sensor histidine kinase [Geminicoccus roseus]|uniref:sensor histidine kinase n=1 Tax=Geminicoccus roseus TaxID=404900 RepID=UPI00040F4D2E|nr:HWE histidine kinase domain-containing protein [Geminicoccus roseus]
MDNPALEPSKEAQASNERCYRILADHAPVLIWRCGMDKACAWTNKAWLDFTGTSLGPEFRWADVIHPDDYQRCLEVFTSAFDTGERFTMDYRLRRHDGVYRWIRDNGAPFTDENGGMAGYFGSGIDVTDHVENEIALRRALAQADSYDQKQKQAQWRQDLLIGELNHRVKNTLATVQSIAAQSFRGSTDVRTGLATFEGRLIALSRAHDVLTKENWLGAPLREVMDAGIEPFCAGGRSRFSVAGPPINVTPKMALALTMGIHELCTNAVKYGALSNAAGRVLIEWWLHDVADGLVLELRWQEVDGPPVNPPVQRGFGTRLIEKGLAREFGGTAEMAFEPAGLVCTIRAPIPAHELNLVGGLVAPHR